MLAENLQQVNANIEKACAAVQHLRHHGPLWNGCVGYHQNYGFLKCNTSERDPKNRFRGYRSLESHNE